MVFETNELALFLKTLIQYNGERAIKSCLNCLACSNHFLALDILVVTEEVSSGIACVVSRSALMEIGRPVVTMANDDMPELDLSVMLGKTPQCNLTVSLMPSTVRERQAISVMV